MKKLLLAILASLLPLSALAQSWPSRPVKFILPLGPGSGADLTGRMLADRLSKQWGQPVVVENRPGADAVLAINAVIAAKDDHTLLYGPSGSFVGHPYTLDKVPYDRNELVPVARVSNTVVVLAAPAALKAQSLKEIMQMARAEPGKLNYASVTQVYAIVRGHAQGGRIRLIAVQNRTRAPGLDIPTVAEAGFPELQLDGLVGLMAARSSGLGNAAIERIAADVKTHLSDPALNERMTATGQIVNPGSPAEFATAIDQQSKSLEAWSKAIGGKLK